MAAAHEHSLLRKTIWRNCAPEVALRSPGLTRLRFRAGLLRFEELFCVLPYSLRERLQVPAWAEGGHVAPGDSKELRPRDVRMGSAKLQRPTSELLLQRVLRARAPRSPFKERREIVELGNKPKISFFIFRNQ